MPSNSEQKKHHKPDEYFDDTIALLVQLKQIIREDFPPPAEVLFSVYNKLIGLTFDEIGDSKEKMKIDISQARKTFDSLNKKVVKLKEPDNVPFSLKVTIGASKEKAKKHLFDSYKAADALLKYLDSGDNAHLQNAYGLLSQMTG
jgi:hypothetical protein